METAVMSVYDNEHRVAKKGKRFRSILNFLHFPGKSRRTSEPTLARSSPAIRRSSPTISRSSPIILGLEPILQSGKMETLPDLSCKESLPGVKKFERQSVSMTALADYPAVFSEPESNEQGPAPQLPVPELAEARRETDRVSRDMLTTPKRKRLGGLVRSAADLFDDSYFEDDYWQDFRDIPSSVPSTPDDFSIDVEACSEGSNHLPLEASSSKASLYASNRTPGSHDSFQRFAAARNAARKHRCSSPSPGGGNISIDEPESLSRASSGGRETVSAPDLRTAETISSVGDDGVDVFDDSGLHEEVYGQKLRPDLFSLNIVVEQSSIFSDTNNCQVPDSPRGKKLPTHPTSSLTKDLNKSTTVVHADVHVDAGGTHRPVARTMFVEEETGFNPPLKSRKNWVNSKSMEDLHGALPSSNVEQAPRKTKPSLSSYHVRGKVDITPKTFQLDDSAHDKAFVSTPTYFLGSEPNAMTQQLPQPLQGLLTDLNSRLFTSPKVFRPAGADQSNTIKYTNVPMRRSRSVESLSFPISSDSDLSPGDFLPLLTLNSAERTAEPSRPAKRRMSHRRSIESGYCSSKPPSPELPAKFSLSVMRGGSSPAFLNRLDGIEAKSPRYSVAGSPKFRFSPTSPRNLNPVLEARERSSPASSTSGVLSLSISDRSHAIHDVTYDVVSTKMTDDRIQRWIDTVENSKQSITGGGKSPKSNVFDWRWSASALRTLDCNNCVGYPVELGKRHHPVQLPKTSSSLTSLNIENGTNLAEMESLKQSSEPNVNMQENSNKESSSDLIKRRRLGSSPCSKYKMPQPVSASSPMAKLSPRETRRRSSQGAVMMSPVKEVWEGEVEAKPKDRPKRLRKKKPKKLSSEKQIYPIVKSPVYSEDAENHAQAMSDSDFDKLDNSPRILRSPVFPHKQYLILKKAADFLTARVPINTRREKNFDMATVMNFFHSFLKSNKAVSLYNTKVSHHGIDTKSLNASNITLDNCMDLTTLACLKSNLRLFQYCISYAFRNLRSFSKREDFLSAPPEIAAVFLWHPDTRVVNSQGFPRSFHDGEKIVVNAVKRWEDWYRSANGKGSKVDAKVDLLERGYVNIFHYCKQVLTSASVDSTSSLHASPDTSRSMCGEMKDFTDTPTRRSFYQIVYEPSCRSVSAEDTRQEYLFQPFLSSCPTLRIDESLPNGSTASPVLPEKSTHVASFLNPKHVPRRLYFSFRRHNKVPHITGIGVQYTFKGSKRRVHVIGSPMLKNKRGDDERSSEATSTESASEMVTATTKSFSSANNGGTSPSASSQSGLTYDVDGPTKTTCLALKPGEHVVGMAVQGESVLHNVEVTTSLGRRVLAHGMSVEGNTPWTRVAPPRTQHSNTPFCLQAVCATACKPSTRSYLRDFSVIWAKVSIPQTPRDLQEAMRQERILKELPIAECPPTDS